MSSVRSIWLTAATAATALASAFFGNAASAADLPPPPIVIHEFKGWYLRGDIGITNQRVKSLENVLFASAPGFAFLDEPDFGTGMLVGLGIGYEVNHWLRLDITGEYRGKTQFHALDRFLNAGVVNTNDYTAKKSEWLFLANAYVDLGTWWCITPFIGAGAGLVDITIHHFRDNNLIAGGGGWAGEASKTNFAWALHAGLSYRVTPSFAVEFAYRYLGLGDGQTADPVNLDGTNSTLNNPFVFNNITSHDVKLGLRWTCCDTDGRVAQSGPGYFPPEQSLLLPPPRKRPSEPFPPLMRKG